MNKMICLGSHFKLDEILPIPVESKAAATEQTDGLFVMQTFYAEPIPRIEICTMAASVRQV